MNKNKSLWITGASSGIGKAIALRFSGSYGKLVLSSRNEEELHKVASMVTAKNGNADILPLDISNNTEVEKAAGKIFLENQLGCLINNAGITTFTTVLEDNVSDIQKIIETNLLGNIYTIKSVISHMIEKNYGMIINILSVAAKKIFLSSSAYSASKAGLLAYTNVLREELRGYNIKIINILPGATSTPIWPAETLQNNADRMMSPGDLADLVYKLHNIDSNLVPEEVIVRPLKGDL